MSTSAIPLRKRSIDSDSANESKRPRNTYFYFRLASESSAQSADDTESIYSIQNKETDIAKDTSDTESDTSEFEVEIEYDIASLSESDRQGINIDSSSGSEDLMVAAAAVVCDSFLETCVTDAEDSDNSRQDDSSTGLTDFWTCIQCKSQNDNPQFRFCDKCFQDRKMSFPPRPRRHKKARRSKEKPNSPVKLDVLKSCLNGLSQDSGISSSHELASLGSGSSQELACLGLDQIGVPEHLTADMEKPSTSVKKEDVNNRKRQISASSVSDEFEVPHPKKHKKEENKENGVVIGTKSDKDQARTTTEQDQVKGPLPEFSEKCIICNIKPKNGIFLHGRIGHMCCCYQCAMRTWKSLKRCPICKRTINNVIKVFHA